MSSFLRACLVSLAALLAAAAAASGLDVANEVAARVGGRVVDVRSAAALIDASDTQRDANAVRDALDGATLLRPPYTDPARAGEAFAVGVRTPDERLVVLEVVGTSVRWSSTTLSDNLRLLPGFRGAEGPFPPDFDYTDSDFNRARYGGGGPVDERDFELRCTSSADSNGATLTCANGYGREIYTSRCYRTLENEVACEETGP